MSPLSFLKNKKKAGDQEEEPLKGPDREKDHEPAEVDESNWLISYADMMTLLCAFFIMMFSMSTLQAPKFEKAKEEVSKHFGGDYESPNKQLAKFVTQILEQEGIDKEAVVMSDASGVSVVFESTVFFDSLSAYIKSPGRKVLRKLIQGVKKDQIKREQTYKIVVEGHTDSQPILSGNYPSNWELSGARSSKVVRLFLDEGFQPEQLMPIGFGSTRPMVPNRSPSGQWVEQNLSKNRRVVIRILNPGIDYIPWDSDSISQTADSHPNHDSKKIESKLPSKETIKAKQNVSSLTPNPSR